MDTVAEKEEDGMGAGEGNPRKRPAWIWVIAIFFFLSAGWTLLSLWLVLSGRIPLEPAQEAYFKSLTPFDYGLTVVLGLTNLVGAAALLMLRRLAFYCFVGGFALNVLITASHIFSKGWTGAMGGSALVGFAIGYGIVIAVCLYVWTLKKSGVLT